LARQSDLVGKVIPKIIGVDFSNNEHLAIDRADEEILVFSKVKNFVDAAFSIPRSIVFIRYTPCRECRARCAPTILRRGLR
jgi:hypothetical protein